MLISLQNEEFLHFTLMSLQNVEISTFCIVTQLCLGECDMDLEKSRTDPDFFFIRLFKTLLFESSFTNGTQKY